MREFFRPPENAGNALKFLAIGFILGLNTGRRQYDFKIEMQDGMSALMFFAVLYRFSGTMEQKISQASFVAIGMAVGLAVVSSLMTDNILKATDNNPPKHFF